MRLATLAEGGPDGVLIVVSRDTRCFARAGAVAQTLQAALEHWSSVAPALEALASELEAGRFASAEPLEASRLLAPLPRAWQWLDGSVYASHGELMDKALNITAEKVDRPLMYQGLSDRFYGPYADLPMVDEALGIDFEGEFGVIVDETPVGTSTAVSASHIRLLVQINDWSLRALARPNEDGVRLDPGQAGLQHGPFRRDARRTRRIMGELPPRAEAERRLERPPLRRGGRRPDVPRLRRADRPRRPHPHPGRRYGDRPARVNGEPLAELHPEAGDL